MSSKKQEYYVKKFNLCDRNHFWILKGLSILAALVAVFLQDLLNIGNGTPMFHTAAAVFVLCSGFGVSESFLKKKGLVHYWENKLIKIWIPSVVIVVVLNVINTGNVASWIGETPLGLKGKLLYLIFGGYAAFWLAFRLLDNKSTRILVLFLCAAAAFAFLPENLGIKFHVFAFPVGVLLSQTGWKRAMMKAGWGIKLAVLAACLILAAGGWISATFLDIPYVHTLLLGVCYLAAALSLFLLTYYLRKIPVWGIFVPFGGIAYTLYLIYDSVFQMFAGKDDIKMYLILFVVLFAAATLLAFLRDLLSFWNYKMRRRGKAHLKGSME